MLRRLTGEVWQEDKEIIDRINGSAADIVWVGLGSPKQDFWMHLHRPLLNALLLLGQGLLLIFVQGSNLKPPDGCRVAD